MRKIFGKFLCFIGFHVVNEDDWAEVWEDDDINHEFYDGQSNFCNRCNKQIFR